MLYPISKTQIFYMPLTWHNASQFTKSTYIVFHEICRMIERNPTQMIKVWYHFYKKTVSDENGSRTSKMPLNKKLIDQDTRNRAGYTFRQI